MNIRQKKIIILWLGVVLYFLATMNKVVIPAAIMDELLALKTLSVEQIAFFGGAFWYAYAASQLLSGVFSDRYGGVRVLLIGGTFFSLGVLGFPLTQNFPLMLFCRVLPGLGAGAVFLGVVKLLADCFSEKFSLVMGIVLFAGFLGIPSATSPMTALVHAAGWRWAMFLPGIFSLATLLGIVLLVKGTIQPTRQGNAIAPLREMMKNGPMRRLCLSSSILFAAYYMVLMLVGQKSLTDIFALDRITAARVMLALTVFVAAMNMGVSGLLKLFGNRRKAVAFLGCFCTLAGSAAGLAAFSGDGVLPLLLAAYFLLAVPGGFFPLFSTMGKELTPPENAGLAVAVVNFSAAVVIAIFQNLGGAVLGCYPMENQLFPLAAYRMLFLLLVIISALGTALLCFVPETGKTPQRH